MPGSHEVICVADKNRPMNRRTTIFLACLWSTVFLAGCSGQKPYQNTMDNNLHVRTTANSGSWFSSVRAAVDIHRVTPECKTEYEGTVQLNGPTIDIGIPPDRWSRLVFVFDTSSFLANRSGSITYETLLKPRSGYQYEARVTYSDDMYNVVVRETLPSSSVGREIEHQDLRACSAKSRERSRVSSNSFPR
jgi:hypothetical protein